MVQKTIPVDIDFFQSLIEFVVDFADVFEQGDAGRMERSEDLTALWAGNDELILFCREAKDQMK